MKASCLDSENFSLCGFATKSQVGAWVLCFFIYSLSFILHSLGIVIVVLGEVTLKTQTNYQKTVESVAPFATNSGNVHFCQVMLADSKAANLKLPSVPIPCWCGVVRG